MQLTGEPTGVHSMGKQGECGLHIRNKLLLPSIRRCGNLQAPIEAGPMANPYRELFNAPGSRAFVLAGMIARMPISMTGIGLITMLSQLQGGYGWPGGGGDVCPGHGVLRAAGVAAGGSFWPAANLAGVGVDRWWGAVDGVAVHPFAGAAWTLFMFAALAGCMPSMSAMVRARWTEVYRGQPQLQTAYALESVLDEVCFIVGPPLSVGFVRGGVSRGRAVGRAVAGDRGDRVCVATRTEPALHPQKSHHQGRSSVQPTFSC
jgi:hypothetical protein